MQDIDIQSYEENGFLVLPEFVPEKSCLELKARALEIIAQTDTSEIASTFSTTKQTHTQDNYFMESASEMKCFFEAGIVNEDGSLKVEPERAINKIGHAQHDLDPVFEAFSYTPELAGIAKALGYSRPLSLQAMYIFKAPGTGGEVIAHTDHPFLWTEPKTVTGLWFAIDNATEENGCLWVMPGGHKTEPVRSRFRRSESGGTTTDIYDETPFDMDKFIPMPAKRGTAIILNGLLPHKSEHNFSDKPRHAYTLHIIEGDESKAHYLEDNWLQRKSELPLRSLFEVAENLAKQ